MKDIFDHLFRVFGTQAAVAKALGYTDRQYLNIRRKVERGERLHPRVTTFILVRVQMIKRNSVDSRQDLFLSPRSLTQEGVQRRTYGT